jgi:type IV pilus assembly protein PilE
MASKPNGGRARARGFTLIEIMIVVVIVAILAAIAIPSYSRYAYRSRRADAQTLLMRIATAQERWYATHNTYASLTDLGYSSPAQSEHGFYSISVPTFDSSSFTATAAPNGVQASDVCGSLTIDSTGNKTFSGTESNGSCW